MKQIKFSLLSLLMLAFFSACGGGSGNDSSNQQSIDTSNNQTEDNQTSSNDTDKFGYSCELKTVNTYDLPPCPNQSLSDSTLLGIDSNDNGVRDDVERWLIMKYKEHHIIVTQIGFQGARADQFMLANPSEWGEKGKANKMIEASGTCNAYFMRIANEYNEPIVIDHSIFSHKRLYDTVQFNTNDRMRAYLQFDQSLSGGVYTLPKGSTARSYCAFDIDKFLGK